MRRDAATFVRENIEAFAVAIALALVIRHFCVEAFRIPTGSMRPTLLGDDTERGRHGDRLLVDKSVWLRRDPQRYEVAVFQYPLNRSKNFIKRILGMPGEWIRIRDGDVWVSRDDGATWSCSAKPEGVQDQLFFPFYPEPIDDPAALRDQRPNWDADPGWTVDEASQSFEVDAGDAASALTFRPSIPAYHQAGIRAGDGGPVGDVRLRVVAEIRRAGTLSIEITEHGRAHVLTLASAHASVTAVGAETRTTELPFRLEVGREHEIEFANADGFLSVRVDGHSRRVEIPGDATMLPLSQGVNWGRHAIALRAQGIAARLDRIRIDRDVYYQPGDRREDETWRIPPDHYFMLGDNSSNSQDSRKWSLKEVVLDDGTIIRWETGPRDGVANPDSMQGGPQGVTTIQQDADGLQRRFSNNRVVSERTSVPSPYVPRKNLIGRAFVVFWPLFVPALYDGPTRVKLIR
ncbi:MAG: signal peptidase I [Planctomycetaceae bacterium]